MFAWIQVRSSRIDGDFGRKTDDAVRRFQTASGLIVDGIVGCTTRTALATIDHGPISPDLTKFVTALGAVDEFVGYVRHEARVSQSIAEALKKLRDFPKKDSGQRRYLIVRCGGGPGIVDFRHFFAAASESSSASGKSPVGGGNRGDTMIFGLAVEINQCFSKKQFDSCFAREDLGSNRLGAEFGRFVKARLAENSAKAPR